MKAATACVPPWAAPGSGCVEAGPWRRHQGLPEASMPFEACALLPGRQLRQGALMWNCVDAPDH